MFSIEQVIKISKLNDFMSIVFIDVSILNISPCQPNLINQFKMKSRYVRLIAKSKQMLSIHHQNRSMSENGCQQAPKSDLYIYQMVSRIFCKNECTRKPSLFTYLFLNTINQLYYSN